MLDKIPQSRILVYLGILGIIPVIVVFMSFWQKSSELELVDERIERIQSKAVIRDTKQAINMAVIEHYRKSDNFYIDKYLEKLQFLEPEVEGLQRIINNKKFADDEEARKRYEFLVGPNNALMYSEGAVLRYPLFREIVETQVRPVEVDKRDIQRILSLIEGVPIGGNTVPPNHPQLIILEFRLDKKTVSEDNEVYLLNTRLLKREYL